MAEIGTSIAHAATLLRKGAVVAIPTETVYGLAANAFQPEAVSEIYRVKNRPSFDPLIVHIGSFDQLDQLAHDIPSQAQKLAETYWPGPLTLLLNKQDVISDLVTAGMPRVALRMPNHPLTLDLLRQLDFPLTAPSANPFGYISPTTAQHVQDQLGHRIPYILDGGACQVGLESTIVGFEREKVVVMRKGGVPVEHIESVVGSIEVRAHSSSNPQAPGMLRSHYAPQTPFFVGDLPKLLKKHRHERVGVLAYREVLNGVPADRQIVLSPSGDEAEAARKFFSALRELDRMKLDCVLAEWMPERGLGRAINDRLKRAAAR